MINGWVKIAQNAQSLKILSKAPPGASFNPLKIEWTPPHYMLKGFNLNFIGMLGYVI